MQIGKINFGFFALLLCSLVLILSIPTVSYAKTSSEIKAEQEKVAEEKKELEAEMKKLDEEMAELQEKLRTTNTTLEETNKEIFALENEIKELEERIAKREEILGSRLRSIQESGGVSNYLNVLFGADSFSDFLSKLNSVSTIVDADKELIAEHTDDQAQLEESQATLQTTKEKLTAAKESLEKNEKEIETATENKEAILKKLNIEANQLEAELSAKEKEEIMKAQNTSSASSEGGSYPSDSGGLFMRPAVGPVTSEFGSRSLGMHYGLDIGKRGSSVPIVASAAGKVINSYYSSSYGNVIFIQHTLNGRLYTTVYAHMESRAVETGASVEKGQFIGYMGNTGQSFGAHLHFEIHEGSWNGSKSNAVNPRKYINF